MPFSRDHLRILHALGPRLGAALSNGRKLTEAQDNAVTDYLTGPSKLQVAIPAPRRGNGKMSPPPCVSGGVPLPISTVLSESMTSTGILKGTAF